MANVTFLDEAFRDGRFGALARRFGMSRAWGRGIVLSLWSTCTELNTYDLPITAVDAIGMDDGGVEGLAPGLIASGLAEAIEGERVRLKGTEGRIEWLADCKAAGRRGGLASAEKRRQGQGTLQPPLKGPFKGGLKGGSSDPEPPDPDPDPEGRSPEEATDSVGLAPDGRQLGLQTANGSPVAPAPAAGPPRKATPVPVIQLRARAEAALYMEWFNRTFGRQFSVRGENVGQVKSLLVERHTQGEMRMVALHLRREWAGKDVEKDLVPMTLLKLKRFGERVENFRQDEPELARQFAALDAKPIEMRLAVALEKTRTGPVADALAASRRDLGAPLLRSITGGRT